MVEETGQAPDDIAHQVADLVGRQVHVTVGVRGWYFVTSFGRLQTTDQAGIFELVSPGGARGEMTCVFNLDGVYEASADEQVILLKPSSAHVEAMLDELEVRNLRRVIADWRALESRSLAGTLLQERWGVSRQYLQQLRADDKLLGVPLPLRRDWYYPVWQFGPDGAPLPDLPAVLAAVRQARLDPLALDALIVNPRAGDGLAPAERLRQGQRDLVLSLIGAAGDQGA